MNKIMRESKLTEVLLVWHAILLHWEAGWSLGPRLQLEEDNANITAKAQNVHHEEPSNVQVAFANDVQYRITGACYGRVRKSFWGRNPRPTYFAYKRNCRSFCSNKTFWSAKTIAKQQFDAFANDHLFKITQKIEEPIKKNKLQLFGTIRMSNKTKGK